MRNFKTKILVLPFIMLLCACSLTKETTGDYVDDTAITSRVIYNLSRKIEAQASDIVQLSGFVTDYNVASRAEEIASKVKNVQSVKNNILVKNSTIEPSKSKGVTTALSDSKITADIKQKLLREKVTSSQSIHVTTRNGVVTLSGIVKNHKEATTAEKIAKDTSDVKKVINKLSL